AKAEAYNVTMYIMAGILLIGFLSNLLIRPVHEKHHMKHDELDEFDGAYPPAKKPSSPPIVP
ncbi:MAG: hypothetical protein ACU83O_06980, partial [Gammaproteobacteria bacterium]